MSHRERDPHLLLAAGWTDPEVCGAVMVGGVIVPMIAVLHGVSFM